MPHRRRQKTLRVAIAAGGTGGHIMPAIALSEALSNIGYPVEIEFLCGNRPIEREIYAEAGIQPHVFPVQSISNRGLGQRALQSAGLGYGLVKSLAIIRRYDIVVGMGGYITAPVLTAAWMGRVPFLVHDSNSIMGRVNKMMAPKAKAIACGMPLVEIPEKVNRAQIFEVGTPVRRDIPRGKREEAVAEMFFQPDGFTFFINGGSQGALGVNKLMIQTLCHISANWDLDRNLQVIWSTGPKHLEMVRQALNEQPLKGQFYIAPTIDRMDQAYAVADLVLCRAGGSTIAEILLCGLPSILFPLPNSTDNHQQYNAILLRRRQAARVYDEDEIEPRELARDILRLVHDPERLQSMSEAAKRLACPGAARDLARLVVETAIGEPLV